MFVGGVIPVIPPLTGKVLSRKIRPTTLNETERATIPDRLKGLRERKSLRVHDDNIPVGGPTHKAGPRSVPENLLYLVPGNPLDHDANTALPQAQEPLLDFQEECCDSCVAWWAPSSHGVDDAPGVHADDPEATRPTSLRKRLQGFNESGELGL